MSTGFRLLLLISSLSAAAFNKGHACCVDTTLHLFAAALLWAGKADDVALAVNAGNEHRSAVFVATRLVGRNQRRRILDRSHISQRFAETAVAKFVGAAEIFDGVVKVVGRDRELHGAIVLVAQRQDVDPHRPSLANLQLQTDMTRAFSAWAAASASIAGTDTGTVNVRSGGMVPVWTALTSISSA